MKPEFHVIKAGRLTTYVIEIPDTAEGIDMLDEVGRMFSHRAEYETAKRIANTVNIRKQELHSPTPGAKSSPASKSSVPSEAPYPRCIHCGQHPGSVRHSPRYTRPHAYEPEPAS